MPGAVRGLILSQGGRELAVQRQRDGYGVIEVYDLSGKLLRSISTEEKVFEYPVVWSSDDSQLVVGFQDLYGDGSYKLGLQPAAGGARRLLAVPPTTFSGVAFFADSGRKVITTFTPIGSKLLRIPVP